MKNDMNIELFEDEIESIEYCGDNETVDITVDDTHMFFANDIYTHNSGFGSEFVEAHQSGGSIKRIQKAHFFMSIAKTPQQQEANLANIRIIKARFAKDGQSFEDCKFNNDTMVIDIKDPRYVYSKTYKDLPHHDEIDVNRVEKKADGFLKINVALSQYGENKLLEKVNNNEVVNDMLRENLILEEIKPNIEFRPEAEFHEKEKSIEEINEDVKSENMFELDESVDIEILDDAVNDGVNDGVNSELLDYDDDNLKITEESEVEINNISSFTEEVEIISESDDVMKEPEIITQIPLITTEPIIKELPSEITNQGFSDIEKSFVDPDTPQGDDKYLNDLLVKKRDYQYVIKKV
jgi:hypothetical protein